MARLTGLIVGISLAVVSVVSVAASWSSVQVAEAKLGTGVENREVLHETTTFAVGDRVYLALKLTGGPSDPIKVNWTIGEYTDSVSLSVGGETWRTWAYKTAFKAGNWTVTVTDSTGTTLKDLAFTVK